MQEKSPLEASSLVHVQDQELLAKVRPIASPLQQKPKQTLQPVKIAPSTGSAMFIAEQI